jgi:Flp pilus assembly protein TadD
MNLCFKPLGLWVAIACLLLLPACAAKTPQPTTAPESGPRLCLRVLWLRDAETADRIFKSVKGGEHFVDLAYKVTRAGPRVARDRTHCLNTDELAPVLIEASEGLAPGQVGGPVPLNQGWALVRVTTDYHFEKAKALIKERKYDEAEEALLLDLKLNPDNVVSWHLLGINRVSQGKLKPALEAFNKALGWAPNDAALLNDRASVLWDLGQRDQAVADYRQALKLKPEAPFFMNNLAWALVESGGDLEQAEELARKACSLAPDRPRFWETLAQVQQAREKYALAVVSWHRAVVSGGTRPETDKLLIKSLKSLDHDTVARLIRRPPQPAQVPQPKPEAAPKPKAETKPIPAPAAAPKETAKQTAAAKPPGPEKPLKPASAAEGKGFFLQVASYRSLPLAQKEKVQWQKLGLACQVLPITLKNGGEWQRVLLGPLENKEAARNLGRKLKGQGKIKSYIIVELR